MVGKEGSWEASGVCRSRVWVGNERVRRARRRGFCDTGAFSCGLILKRASHAAGLGRCGCVGCSWRQPSGAAGSCTRNGKPNAPRPPLGLMPGRGSHAALVQGPLTAAWMGTTHQITSAHVEPTSERSGGFYERRNVATELCGPCVLLQMSVTLKGTSLKATRAPRATVVRPSPPCHVHEGRLNSSRSHWKSREFDGGLCRKATRRHASSGRSTSRLAALLLCRVSTIVNLEDSATPPHSRFHGQIHTGSPALFLTER